MSDLLQLPIDSTVSFGGTASYKNPARIVVRASDDRVGWRVYYCLADGRHWYLATIEQTAQGTAIVFAAGSGNELGVNQRLAEESGDVTAREIHDAEHFYVFAVSPDGTHRSLVHEFANDRYTPASGNTGPPWKLDGYGWPVKDKQHRGIFRRTMDFPPDYEAGGTPPPPPDDEPDDPPDPPDPGDEPDSLIEIVREERARYDTPMREPEMGVLLNAVAWQARVDGWGLAHKPTGAHTLQPRTGIRVSRDLLIHRATRRTYDVLANVEGDAKKGPQAAPTWNYVETGILDWVAPVEPDGVEPDPDPEPEPAPQITYLSYPAEVAAGERFEISWETEHAEHVELLNDDGYSRIVVLNGRVVRSIAQTTEWTIRAVRGALVAEDGFIVRVRQPAPPPPPPDPPPPPPPEPDPPPPPPPPRSWWDILRDLIRQLTGGGS
jgi:hypothetical protein